MVSYLPVELNIRHFDMRVVSAQACANLAFVKYWGKRDARLNLPLNNSISMTLDGARTTTTVRFDDSLDKDVVLLAGAAAPPRFAERVSRHLERIRVLAGVTTSARVETENNFPAGTGFASSASGFAALTLAATKALALEPGERELSALARRGSGSACRSIPAGYAEWHAGEDDASSYATQLAPAQHWGLVDVAVLVAQDAKEVPSSDGHRLVANNPFWQTRSARMPARLETVRQALLARDFHRFGREVEAEAMEMHAIMLTSAYERAGTWHPGIFYWTPDTLRILCRVSEWRRAGLAVYFTLDAGPTVHLLCQEGQVEELMEAVRALDEGNAWRILPSRPGPGARLVSGPDAAGQ